jgi:hypothetical protein
VGGIDGEPLFDHVVLDRGLVREPGFLDRAVVAVTDFFERALERLVGGEAEPPLSERGRPGPVDCLFPSVRLRRLVLFARAPPAISKGLLAASFPRRFSSASSISRLRRSSASCTAAI